MSKRSSDAVSAYRFSLSAICFGRDEDEAFESLLESLMTAPEEALEEMVSFEQLPYVVFTPAGIIPEA